MPTFDLSQISAPTFGPYQLTALIVFALLTLLVIWIVRKKPYVAIKILGLLHITISDTPPEEPKKLRKKDDRK